MQANVATIDAEEKRIIDYSSQHLVLDSTDRAMPAWKACDHRGNYVFQSTLTMPTRCSPFARSTIHTVLTSWNLHDPQVLETIEGNVPKGAASSNLDYEGCEFRLMRVFEPF